MNIALSAKRFINNDITYNLSVIIQTMRVLAGKADLICFGEAFLQGFDSLVWNYDIDKDVGISITSPQIELICKIAKETATAVAFGYIESENNFLYSSYLVISKYGEKIYNYRRLSIGWKEPIADFHYKEGMDCKTFEIDGHSFSIGLCGDLWDNSIVNKIKSLQSDITIWPVYVDYSESRWNDSEKTDYAKQALLFNNKVLLVNSICDGENKAKGGAAYFVNGIIADEVLPGTEKTLIVSI